MIRTMTDNASPQTRRELRVTTDGNGNPTLTPTPKVAAAAAAMGILVVVVAILGGITPELLTFAGPWSGPLFAGITALTGFLAGYIKRP